MSTYGIQSIFDKIKKNIWLTNGPEEAKTHSSAYNSVSV